MTQLPFQDIGIATRGRGLEGFDTSEKTCQECFSKISTPPASLEKYWSPPPAPPSQEESWLRAYDPSMQGLNE